MNKYWNITITLIVTTFVAFACFNLSTSIVLRSPNLAEFRKLNDFKLIFELSRSLESVYSSGSIIETPEIRYGGGVEVQVKYLNGSKSYYLQGDRLIYTEENDGLEVFKSCVRVNRKDLETLSRRILYIWNQLENKHGKIIT